MNLLDLLPELADQPVPIAHVRSAPITSGSRFFKPRLVELTVDGNETITREIAGMGASIGVLLHDPVLQAVLVVEEPAAGAFAYHAANFNNCYRYAGIVCGRVNRDENPANAVLREVAEETGLDDIKIRLQSLLVMGPSMFIAPTISMATMQLFYVQADLRDLSQRQHDDNPWCGKKAEFVRPWIVPQDRFIETALCVDGGPVSAPCVMVALWLASKLPHLPR